MHATVHVVEPDYFDTKPWPEVPDDPVEAGAYYYKGNCAICHSIDGTRVVGPSFQGLWGREGTLETGEKYVVDEAYVRSSIRNPMSQIVQGYPAGMTQFTEAMLSDDAISNIIEWMKTLK